jgi:hypothetical protein
MKFHTVIVQKDKVTTVRLVPSTCLSMKQKLHAGILTKQRATILANVVLNNNTTANDANNINMEKLSVN